MRIVCEAPISSELREEVVAVPLEPVSGGHSGTGYQGNWINGLHQARIRENDYPYVPHIMQAVDRLAVDKLDHNWRIQQIMVNRLDGGHTLNRHRDAPNGAYRFHLPIITNSNCLWWDEFNGYDHMAVGYWYGPVPFAGVMHFMENGGSTFRYHLVLDLLPPT